MQHFAPSYATDVNKRNSVTLPKTDMELYSWYFFCRRSKYVRHQL